MTSLRCSRSMSSLDINSQDADAPANVNNVGNSCINNKVRASARTDQKMELTNLRYWLKGRGELAGELFAIISEEQAARKKAEETAKHDRYEYKRLKKWFTSAFEKSTGDGDFFVDNLEHTFWSVVLETRARHAALKRAESTMENGEDAEVSVERAERDPTHSVDEEFRMDVLKAALVDTKRRLEDQAFSTLQLVDRLEEASTRAEEAESVAEHLCLAYSDALEMEVKELKNSGAEITKERNELITAHNELVAEYNNLANRREELKTQHETEMKGVIDAHDSGVRRYNQMLAKGRKLIGTLYERDAEIAELKGRLTEGNGVASEQCHKRCEPGQSAAKIHEKQA